MNRRGDRKEINRVLCTEEKGRWRDRERDKEREKGVGERGG
jgi:hypothetical protein